MIGHLCAVLALGQLFDHIGFGLDLGQRGIDRLYRLIALDQRHGRLFAHARHAGNVVRAVAHQRFEIDDMDRGKAVLLAERLRRHVPGGGLPHPGGDELDLGMVGDQLQAVLVAGDDDTVPARRLAFAGDRADEVVRLVTGELVARDVHRVEHLFEDRHLHGKLLGHALALGLVAVIFQMAEGRLAAVKGHAQRIRLLLVFKARHGGEKPVDRMGVEPLPRGQRADAIIGAVDDRIAVDYHQLHGALPLKTKLTKILYRILPIKTTKGLKKANYTRKRRERIARVFLQNAPQVIKSGTVSAVSFSVMLESAFRKQCFNSRSPTVRGQARPRRDGPESRPPSGTAPDPHR